MKKSKGITLIALVITIIVLLILAGVSIALLTGENGLIAKAIAARNRTEEAKLDEENKLAQTNEIMDKYVTNRDGSITIDSDTLNQMIETKVNEKMYSPTIFHGNVVTNTMGAHDTAVKVNEFTVTESGKYVINYISKFNWLEDTVFIVWVYLNDQQIGGNTYSNSRRVVSNNGYLNTTAITNLNSGDTISVLIYQYNNGVAGANNLAQNDLQLIKVGN